MFEHKDPRAPQRDAALADEHVQQARDQDRHIRLPFQVFLIGYYNEAIHTYMFFFLALSLLLTHEMDAIRRHEWKIFPGLSRIKDDERGYLLFTALHVPLYVFLLWGIVPNGTANNVAFIRGLDTFCIMHVVLHVLYMKHPQYQFNNWFSWLLILGAGLAGGIDLLVRM